MPLPHTCHGSFVFPTTFCAAEADILYIIYHTRPKTAFAFAGENRKNIIKRHSSELERGKRGHNKNTAMVSRFLRRHNKCPGHVRNYDPHQKENDVRMPSSFLLRSFYFFARTRNNKICFERCSRPRLHSYSRSTLYLCASRSIFFLSSAIPLFILVWMWFWCCTNDENRMPRWSWERGRGAAYAENRVRPASTRGIRFLRVRVICFPP